jgi:hypothetical protein
MEKKSQSNFIKKKKLFKVDFIFEKAENIFEKAEIKYIKPKSDYFVTRFH